MRRAYTRYVVDGDFGYDADNEGTGTRTIREWRKVLKRRKAAPSFSSKERAVDTEDEADDEQYRTAKLRHMRKEQKLKEYTSQSRLLLCL